MSLPLTMVHDAVVRDVMSERRRKALDVAYAKLTSTLQCGHRAKSNRAFLGFVSVNLKHSEQWRSNGLRTHAVTNDSCSGRQR
jgi:hypothetical protein